MAKSLFIPLLVVALAVVKGPARAAETGTPAQAMAILRASCFDCHNDTKVRGGLDLTSREAAFKGGDSGPAIKTGKGAASPLVKLLARDADPHMPPRKQLPASQIETLRHWIDAGARWDTGTLKLLGRTAAHDELRALPANYAPVLALAVSPDGRRLASARANAVLIHDLAHTNRPVVATLTGARDAIQSVGWSPDGQWLAAGEFRRVQLWDAKTLKLFGTLDAPLTGRATAVAFTPDGKTLAVAESPPGVAGKIHLWRTGDEKPFASWSAHDDSILDLKISPSGKFLATAGADRVAKVWELATKKEVAKLEGHANYVQAVAFGKDDSELATGSADKEIRIWNLESRERKSSFVNRSAAITSLFWTPDGKTLVSAGDDGGVAQFTDLQRHSGEQSSRGGTERKLTAVSDMLHAVTATADGSSVFGGCHDGSIYCWKADQPPEKLALGAEIK